MGPAALLAVFKAIGDVAGAVNNIYEFVKNAQEFFADESESNRDRYLKTYAAIIDTRQAVLDASAHILTAVGALDERIFKSTIADKLGDADAAMQAIDSWRRSGSDAQREIALDRSAGATADLLQLAATGVYPVTSLVFSHVQVLSTRLVILAEADPHFARSQVARQPVADGIALIRSCATQLRQGITEANRITTRTWTTSGPFPPHGGPRPVRHFFRISYSNVSGTSSFVNQYGPQEDEPIETDGPLAAAEAARAKGLADDTAAARLAELDDAADRFERMLLQSELRLLTDAVGHTATALEAARYRQARRENGIARAVSQVLPGWDDPADDVDADTAIDVLTGGRTTPGDADLYAKVAQRFGVSSAVQLWLSALERPT